ncbi:MAG TPA: hypothetical protein VFP64_16085, partial [Pyrinomonadaceae bacterium]|nr:hypothetical protein [Pyrinomonadaceae bacterium]
SPAKISLMMTSETLLSLKHENREGTFTADVRVASSADRPQLEAMTEGLSITMLFCSTNLVCPQTMNVYIAWGDPSVCYPT